ncbi:hypothetical protein [Paractinoplanes brasiliensis]|uniref:hypothetical protein n=1 Tax=Paractinoplanes brasiliensis TaxID=52695 RepID=UPI00105C60E5|nr:hypothetical protein [Actinoplanes brasiliensis]GID32076.1 hypothetical protein Abr02nite_70590 [Actinoplanes brasiliensis]
MLHGEFEDPRRVEVFDPALLTSHVAQFLVRDEQWLSTLEALRRSLVAGVRSVFGGRDPEDRRGERRSPVGSRRTVITDDGDQIDTWTEVNLLDDGATDFRRHYVFTQGDELTGSATLRFHFENEIRTTVEAARLDVGRGCGGWPKEPVGTGEDGELIVAAAARPRGAWSVPAGLSAMCQ